jgi:hypothetical protein
VRDAVRARRTAPHRPVRENRSPAMDSRNSRSALTCAGWLPRALRPGTRPALVLCRSRVDYRLARGGIRHAAQSACGTSMQPERVDGSRRDQSLRPRSGSKLHSVAVRSALLTRLPSSTRERAAAVARFGGMWHGRYGPISSRRQTAADPAAPNAARSTAAASSIATWPSSMTPPRLMKGWIIPSYRFNSTCTPAA